MTELTGIISSVFLVSMLLLVHFSEKTKVDTEINGQKTSALDQDRGLLLPWAGHASNVFSLTALFGGYTVIAVALGLPALVGLAVGGIGALLFMRAIIIKENSSSFHCFLASRQLSYSGEGHHSYWLLLTLTQIVLAISELVILREVALNAFDLPPHHATTLALTLALVAYFYSLIGRYPGIFRTDVVQLFFMVAMCLVAAVFASASLLTDTLEPDNVLAQPLKTDAWTYGITLPPWTQTTLNFIVGTIAGSSLLLSSPDTWKRIFLTSSPLIAKDNRRPFVGLILAGAIPFVLLIPAILLMPRPDLDNPEIFAPLHATVDNQLLLLSIVLGMMSSFLSTFDGALISTTHLLLVRSERQRQEPLRNSADLGRFHIYLGGSFLVIIVGALALISGAGNPYFAGVVVLGMYGILGGYMLGTRLGSLTLDASGSTPLDGLWPVAFGLIGWCVLIISFDGILVKAQAEQLSLVPASVGLYLIFALLGTLQRKRFD